jgi:hypothetical protein
MAAKLKAYAHLAIAHVLFIDMVGCSKLLVNEQREVVDELTCISQDGTVRKSESGGRTYSNPRGRRVGQVFFQTPEVPVQCAMEIARR